jgi:hypothetical protein
MFLTVLQGHKVVTILMGKCIRDASLHVIPVLL